MTKKQKQDLIEYLDGESEKGKEIKLCWEGGGDSGWVWFEIDEEKVSETGSNELIDALVENMYDHLDYGSWAGEYSANGYALYDSKAKAFVGTDYYSEDETVSYECDFEIRVPKSLWFDTLEIQIEGEEPSVDAVFHIKNGFLTNDHHDFINNTLIPDLSNNVGDVINDYIAHAEGVEYRSMWENLDLKPEDFVEDGDNVVHNVTNIGIGTYSTNDREIYLDLNELYVTDEEQ